MPRPREIAPPTQCAGCDRMLVSKHAWDLGVRQGADTYRQARDRCAGCYWYDLRKARRQAERVAAGGGRITPREELLADYDMIRSSVGTIREAAERMGVPFARLDQALYRARRAGDERAKPPRDQLVRAIDRGVPFGRRHPRRTLSEVA